MTEPRKIQDVNNEATKLERTINQELADRWPKHSRLTKDWLVDNVVCKHLNGLWEYVVEVQFISETPFRVHITRYLGPIDES